MTFKRSTPKLHLGIAAGCLLASMASAPLSAQSGSCALLSAGEVEITLDAQGKLVASPPLCLFEGGTLMFKVAEDSKSKEAFVVRDLELYLGALTGTAKLRKEVEDNSVLRFKLLGLSSRDLDDVHSEICRRARFLASGLSNGGATFDTRLDELQCARNASMPSPPTFVAPEKPADYNFSVRCFGRAGNLQARLNTTAANVNGFFTFMSDAVPKDCARVEYELRRTDPLVGRAKQWAEQQQISLALRKLIQDGLEGLDTPPRPKDVVKNYNDFGACLKIAVQPILDNPATADRDLALQKARACELPEGTSLDRAQAEVDQALATIRAIVRGVTLQSVREGWAKRWLWLTGGVPRLNPFQFVSAATRLDAQIKNDTATLADLEAQVATFELIATNKGLAITSLANLPAELKPFAEVRLKRDQLKKGLEQARQSLAGLNESGDSDDLLYRGQLYVSQGGRAFSLRGGPSFAVMQHHDAQQDYLVMSPRTVQEIRETERLYILAENEKEDTKLKAAVTVTRPSTDTSAISAEAALSRVAASGVGPADVDPLAPFLAIFNSYNELVATLAFLEEQLDVPPLPFSPAEDKSPALITRLVPHEIPSNPPAQVSYTIQKKDGEKLEDVWKGEYRVNKLYRIRLKAGLVYSELETSDFTITGATVQEQRDRHGVDGTFGVQIYPFGRRDIRNPGPRDRLLPVVFLGFSMKSPKDDLYAGLGFEPWPGVTVLYGHDYGRGEKMVTGSDGNQQTRSRWDHAPFYSVLIDVDFFRQLFGLKGIL